MSNENESQNSVEEVVKPYISAEQNISEFTIRAVILGVILALIFGAANAYLGLAVGMTVSASIPSAVMSMAILRGLLKKGTILENNIVQTIGTSGESVVAGVIFTIPALIFMGFSPSWFKIFLIALIGGVIGVLMMIPLRRYLIVKEHKNLPYPEGVACAEVLIAGEKGGTHSKFVFSGLALGGIYEFIRSGMLFIKEAPSVAFERFMGATIGFSSSAPLLGVGFIVGAKTGAKMVSGGLLAAFVLTPLIKLIGGNAQDVIAPATKSIAQMDASEIWDNYVRYIGAGAVALGGFISALRALPSLVSSAKASLLEFKGGLSAGERIRTDRDLPFPVIIVGVILCIIGLILIPGTGLGILGAILVIFFGYIFVAISSRIVGLVGSSSSPTSGMTIAALLGVALILKLAGYTGVDGAIAALTIGAVICIAICTSGDTSMDIKTGFYIGSTPARQQMGFLIGTLTTSLISGGIVYLFANKLGTQEMPAPQASMMRVIADGVFAGTLPWSFIIIGIFIGIMIELLGIGSLPFAIGLYLPITTSTPILIGGLISYGLYKFYDEKEARKREDRGILFASGLVAGGALMNVFLAILEVFHLSDNIKIAEKIGFTNSNHYLLVSVIIFLIFYGINIFITYRKGESDEA